ncbi:iron-containing alcohol dehydrogenase [Candidatus Omnitrophus magneticus]|uniref:Iron-containing alcohol dehydrogenase n=1 Tax=Candidatus Omnitrophus magneticus TaxID=1609969 RepID=A0A0F0CMN3_9BACT|nr:iron-containing alcohol dehydrogenase [Candidatus Omnitrophus magneticus]
MPEFIFHNPTRIVFGKDTIKYIGAELKRDGRKKILLLAGGGSIKDNGVYEKVTKSLKDNNIEWIEHWGIRPNPVLSKAYEILQSIKGKEIDACLAVGGGSVIDTAKSIAAGYYLNDIWDAYDRKIEILRALPIYTILTISATGSEMNQFAVLTNESLKRKWNIASDFLYPRVSIIDPLVQMSLPWTQTVNGAIDAVAHIMEYYFTGTSELTTMSIDEALMKSIIAMTDRLMSSPNDYTARANLAWSATLALNGLSGAGLKDGDWTSHWIEHALSANYPDIAHGAGLGVIFPAWIKYMKSYNVVTFSTWAKNVWGTIDVDEAVNKMKEKIKKWGHPVSLEELAVPENMFEQIALNTLEIGHVGAFKEMEKEDIISILKLAA